MHKKEDTDQTKINKIEIKNDTISGRGGLIPFIHYIENTKLFSLINRYLGNIKLSKKGLTLNQFVKQIIVFFMDGTDMSITGFDLKKEDKSYASVLENTQEEMASSHQIKRFFGKFSIVYNITFRKILAAMFIWRLLIEKPERIILQIDTMVLDNDDTNKREGCEPTYKRKKGFQPLHITWDTYIIDALFRSGSKHSNHGNDVIESVERIVKLIRKYYKDVPIILNMDSGFLDNKNFTYFEENLRIHYVCTGKLYKDIKNYAKDVDPKLYSDYEKGKILWKFLEFGNKLKNWTKMRRCIYTTMSTDDKGQLVFEFMRPDNIIYTNLGHDEYLDKRLIEAGGESHLSPEGIIELSHQRGKDELIHRSLKELATKEQLPFKKMHMNRAYYYFMVLSHFLFESYKRDVLKDVVSIVSYPNTIRRRFIDFAVKITDHSGYHIMNVTQAVFDNLKIEKIWELCSRPPKIKLL
ncbi:MAG: IS1380 family transposase [Bacteroidota bacterium]|nr:IS1380 family transposase [Bacteroidota bacterium]